MFNQLVWPILEPLLQDPAWRVRYSCVLRLKQICDSAGKENVRNLILPIFIKFMGEKEKEVPRQ
jgi:hypothetical protein